MNIIFQKLPSWLIAITVVFIPLFSFDNLIDPKLTSRHLLIGILVILLIVFSIVNVKKIVIHKSYIYWCLPFFALFTAYFISSYFSHNIPEANFWMGKIGVYFSLFTVLLLLRFNGLLNTKTIAQAVVISVFIGLFLFVFEANEKQLLKTTTLIDKNLYALSSPFGHKNLYASYLVICLPFLSFLILTNKKFKRLIYIFVLLIGLGTIIVLQAKAAILGLLVGSALLLPLVLLNFRKQNKNIFRILLIGGAFLLISSLLVVFIFQEHFSLLFQTASVKERVLVWENTVNMICENTITGVGGGNWQLFFPKYGLNSFHTVNEKIHLGYQTFQRPHNDFLWIFSEAGLLGIIAFISIFVAGFIGVFKSYKNSNSNIEKIIPLLFGLGIIAYLIISMFDFPLERSEHVFLFILLLVFSIPVSQKSYIGKKDSKLLLILFPLLFISAYSVDNTLLRMHQEKLHLKVLIAHRTEDWKAMLKEENKSNHSVYEIDNFSIPIEWYRGVAFFSLNELEKSKDAFEKAYHLAPYQVHVINNLAGLYHTIGEHDKAMVLYDKALAISSFNAEILLNKSVALYSENKIEAAFDNLLKLEYKKEHPENYHHAMKVIFYTT
jgi:O-antigen ligase